MSLPKQGNLQLLMMDSGIYSHWKAVGGTHSLTLDSDIAAFLLQHYEKFQSADLLDECLKCHGALSQYCDVCCLIYNFTPAPNSSGSCDLDLSPASNQIGLEAGLAGGNTIVIRLSDVSVEGLAQPGTGYHSPTVLGDKPCLSQNNQPPSLQSGEQLPVHPLSVSALLKSAAEIPPDDKQPPADLTFPRTSSAPGTSRVEAPLSVRQSPQALSAAASADEPVALSAGFEPCERPDKVPKSSCIQKVRSLVSGKSLPLTACQDSEGSLSDVSTDDATSPAGLSRLVKDGLDLNNGHKAVGQLEEKTDRQMTASSTTKAEVTNVHDVKHQNYTISIPTVENTSTVSLTKSKEETERLNNGKPESDPLTPFDVPSLRALLPRSQRARRLTPKMESLLMDRKRTLYPKLSAQETVANTNHLPEQAVGVLSEDHRTRGHARTKTGEEVEAHSLDHADSDPTAAKSESSRETGSPLPTTTARNTLDHFARQSEGRKKPESLPPPGWQKNGPPAGCAELEEASDEAGGTKYTTDCGLSAAETFSPDSENGHNRINNSGGKQMAPLTVKRNVSEKTATPATILGTTENIYVLVTDTMQENDMVKGENIAVTDRLNSSEIAADVSRKQRQKFPCKVCGKVMGSKTTLATHHRIHANDRPFRCPHCTSSYTTAAHLKAHLFKHADVKPYQCPECSEAFARPSDLKLHRLKHAKSRPFVCDVCGFGAKTQLRLKKHRRVHEATKAFQCPVCGQKFRWRPSLRDHLKLHTDERPFPCPHCDMKYVQSGSLRRHMERRHTPDRKREWVCHLCGEARYDRWQFDKHMAIHTGSKQHKCQICDAAFIQSSALRSHMKIHRETDGKGHRCPICKAAFKAASSIHKHLKKAHKQEPKPGEEKEGNHASKHLESISAAEVSVSMPQSVGFLVPPSRECLPATGEMVEMVFREDGTIFAALARDVGARLLHCPQVGTRPQEVSVTLADDVSATLPQMILVSGLENFAVSVEEEVKVEFPDTAVVLEEVLR